MIRAPRHPWQAVALLTALSLLAGITPMATPAAKAALDPVGTIIVDGRGFGHGIGVSQWGAYGWATMYGKTWQEILAFYYGGGISIGPVQDGDFTSLPVGRMTVQLTALEGLQTAVVSDTAALTTPLDTEARAWSSLVAREIPGQQDVYAVWGNATATCPASTDPLDPAVGWTLLTPSVPGPVDFSTPNGDAPGAVVPGDLIGVCDGSGAVRYYRGSIRAANLTTGLNRTINNVLLEWYVKGVVPRESFAGWDDDANGAGAHALRTQAVMARSYPLAISPRSTVNKTCDTTSCQVYGGAALRAGGVGTPVRILEDVRTNAAVDETAGIVVRTGSGKVAVTMYASSNGGRTVGGLYPAVDDPGDAVPANPHHAWSTTLTPAAVMAAWPSIGTLLDIEVTKRSGGGTWGGWADTIVLRGSTGNVTATGDDFRRAFGLKSRYVNFTLTRIPAPPPAGPPPAGPVLFIGDSVGHSVRTPLGRLLSDGFEVIYLTKGGRCTVPRGGSCTSNNAMRVFGATPTPAVAVMQLGYNDLTSRFAKTIDTAMTAITAKGTTRVVWINLSERKRDKKGRSVYASSNAALREAATRWPQLVVLDWNAASGGPEADSWFVTGTTSRPNWVHLTSVGRTQFARWVRSQLDQLQAQGALPPAPSAPVAPLPAARPTLKLGASGPSVVELQNALRSFGATAFVDGTFGSTTRAAVKAFQASKGLAADGIVGRGTWAALGL